MLVAPRGAIGAIVAHDRETWRETFDLAFPVPDYRSRRNEQCRTRVAAAPASSRCEQERQQLDGLAEPHVVGETGAEAQHAHGRRATRDRALDTVAACREMLPGASARDAAAPCAGRSTQLGKRARRRDARRCVHRVAFRPRAPQPAPVCPSASAEPLASRALNLRRARADRPRPIRRGGARAAPSWCASARELARRQRRIAERCFPIEATAARRGRDRQRRSPHRPSSHSMPTRMRRRSRRCPARRELGRHDHAEARLPSARRRIAQEAQAAAGSSASASGLRFRETRADGREQPRGAAERFEQRLLRIAEGAAQALRGCARLRAPHVRGSHEQARIVRRLQEEAQRERLAARLRKLQPKACAQSIAGTEGRLTPQAEIVGERALGKARGVERRCRVRSKARRASAAPTACARDASARLDARRSRRRRAPALPRAVRTSASTLRASRNARNSASGAQTHRARRRRRWDRVRRRRHAAAIAATRAASSAAESAAPQRALQLAAMAYRASAPRARARRDRARACSPASR